MITVSFIEPTLSAAKSKSAADSRVVLVAAEGELSPAAQALDAQLGGAITSAITTGRFKGKKGQVLSLIAPHGLKLARLVLLGIGKAEEFDELAAQSAGGALVAELGGSGAKQVSVSVEAFGGVKLAATEIAAHLAYGAALRSYRFDKYRTTTKPEEKPTLTVLELAVKNALAAETVFDPLGQVVEGVYFTRDLVSEPANVINPVTLAGKCRELTKLGVQVEILGEEQMRKLGMHALLGVGQGSANESKLVVMQWKGAKKDTRAPLAFVGKGVTFDTGGISLKPSAGMEAMKWDMGGAGTVIGLMKALAGRKAKVNVVAVVGLAENMPDGNAQRPGDVVTSMSGQTIAVLNTDAEGRLVLADALWYAQERFEPRLVIDLATLTGAVVIALGKSRAGLFSNNDALAGQLFEAGKKTGEEVWRLPLAEAYDKQIDSPIADMQNISGTREAGASVGAQFLQRFIQNKETPWAHLDIAGVAWADKDSNVVPKGASAFGVRLLDRLVAEHYEGK